MTTKIARGIIQPLVNRLGMMPADEANLARTIESALLAIEAETIERCAGLVRELRDNENPGRSKLMLEIASRAIERGRNLTDDEKLDNLNRALNAPEESGDGN